MNNSLVCPTWDDLHKRVYARPDTTNPPRIVEFVGEIEKNGKIRRWIVTFPVGLEYPEVFEYFTEEQKEFFRKPVEKAFERAVKNLEKEG